MADGDRAVGEKHSNEQRDVDGDIHVTNLCESECVKDVRFLFRWHLWALVGG